MNKCLFLVVGLVLSTVGLSSQGKPVIVVQPFTVAPGVELPYDVKLMQSQLVAEFKVMLGKEFEIAPEAPATPKGTVYTLDTVCPNQLLFAGSGFDRNAGASYCAEDRRTNQGRKTEIGSEKHATH